jgi:hypothetical protein
MGKPIAPEFTVANPIVGINSEVYQIPQKTCPRAILTEECNQSQPMDLPPTGANWLFLSISNICSACFGQTTAKQ